MSSEDCAVRHSMQDKKGVGRHTEVYGSITSIQETPVFCLHISAAPYLLLSGRGWRPLGTSCKMGSFAAGEGCRDNVTRPALCFLIDAGDVSADYAKIDHQGAADHQLEQNHGRKAGHGKATKVKAQDVDAEDERTQKDQASKDSDCLQR